MKQLSYIGLLTVLLFVPNWSRAQQAADSTLIFFEEEFYTLVLRNHPLLKQAQLLEEQGKAEVRGARGNFDPKIEASWNQKNFKDTEYYDILNAKLKVPTWLPIDPSLTVDRNEGTYLNDERFISEETDFWQLSTGISVPIGRGLFIDQRRAAVREAQYYREQLQAEQIAMSNKLLLSAAKDYWEWYFAWHEWQQLGQSIQISREITDRTVETWSLGEAALIDTVQASITWQTRRIEYNEASINLARASLQLSVHLWDDTGKPLEIRAGVRPPAFKELQEPEAEPSLDSLRQFAGEKHPDLLKIIAKGEQLEVMRRLAGENLKPTLNLNYYFIDTPFAPSGGKTNFAIDENYKLGVDFSIPLFFRKERAKLQKSKLKILDNDYALSHARLKVDNTLQATFKEWETTNRLLTMQLQALTSYEALLQAELLNLDLGESDLFKINYQQDKLIQARLKYLKLQSRLQKVRMQLRYDTGYPLLNLIAQ